MTPRAARLTPRGRGAVASIRITADPSELIRQLESWFRPASKIPLQDHTVGEVLFGRWGRTSPEDVVLCRTLQNRVDLHCHGGDAAVCRILRDLQSAGCRIESFDELECIQSSSFDADCLAALARAPTLRTANILLDQYSGILRAALEKIYFLHDLTVHRDEILTRLNGLLAWSEFGLHLTQPWRVVVAGKPNVGKSSLVNALFGYTRSIVYNQPGTTRDVVTGETAFDGWPVQLTDTAGVRSTTEPLEAAGIERARQHLAQADCRILLFDVSRPLDDEDHALRSAWPDALLIAHKCDLPPAWPQAMEKSALSVSSRTLEGLETLIAAITRQLIPLIPAKGTAIPVTVQHLELFRSGRAAAEAHSAADYAKFISECSIALAPAG